MSIQSVNPASGLLLKSFDSYGPEQIEDRLAKAVETFSKHRQSSYSERATRLLLAANILEQQVERWARVMTLEMGKPIASARAEVRKCAWVCRFYAEKGEKFLSDQSIATDADTSFVKYQPLGVVLAVMPWNFPFWQVIRFAAPALMAGNACLLKHASNVPQCALALEALFREAGFDPGAFQALLIGSQEVAGIIRDPRVAAVTLTGSEGAGSQVGAEAGQSIKKCVLELGGSDPFIVMPGVNLTGVAKAAAEARTINTGQSCIAAKRFIVHETIATEFERLLVREMEALIVGDPMDEATQIGPLATESILKDIVGQVEQTTLTGGRCLTGGRRLDRSGFYYAPTVLTNIPKGSPAAQEEIFGPVASCFRTRNLEEAIDLANDSRFGLGASLWSEREEEHRLFVDRIEAGAAFVNGKVASDPRLPFGGIKSSGYGRELGREGILEFVNHKTVWIKRAGL